MKKIITIFLLISIISCTKNTTQLKMTEGSENNFYVKSTVELNQQFGERVIDMKIAMIIGFKEIVSSVSKDGHTTTVYFTDVEFDIADSVMQDESFAGMSKEEIEEEIDLRIAQFLAEAKEIPFVITYNNQGEVASLKNFGKIAELVSSEETIYDTFLKDTFVGADMATLLALRYKFIPENNEAVGNSWEKTETISLPYEIQITTKYKITESNDEYKIISSTSTKSVEDSQVDKDMVLNGNIETYGTIKVSATTNQVIEAEIIQISDTVVKANAGLTNIEIPIKMKDHKIFSKQRPQL
ncbi:MAG: hypothetical protein JXR63_11365 [Spirochaetales bacterium]|nr:hypothetical protein [Spirochaetales bacterium]